MSLNSAMKFILGFPDRRVGKESTCNAGDPSLIPGSGRSNGEGIRLPSPEFLRSPGGSADKESALKAVVLDLIPGLGRSPGDGKGDYILLYKVNLSQPFFCASAYIDSHQ